MPCGLPLLNASTQMWSWKHGAAVGKGLLARVKCRVEAAATAPCGILVRNQAPGACEYVKIPQCAFVDGLSTLVTGRQPAQWVLRLVRQRSGPYSCRRPILACHL